MLNKNRKFYTVLILACTLASLNILSVANAKTIVVHLSTYDLSKTTNALLYAKHSCQFLPNAESTTIRILLTNDGALNALKDIRHPRNRIQTLPDDDPKTANHLLRQLLGRRSSEPALRCNIQIAVTGLALRSIGRTADEIFRGIKIGGPKPTTDLNRVQVPTFLSTPEIEGESIVVIDW